jgi:hypothetical protein
MDFYIKHSHENNTILCNLYHDINGNVYISHNDNLFMISIGKDNDIEFYEISIEKLESIKKNFKTKYGNIINNEGSTLKKKTFEKIEQNEDSDQEEEYQNYKEKIKYYKEDKYYCIEDQCKNSDDDEYNDMEDGHFDFYKIDNDNSIKLINHYFESNAIYDTFIRDINNNVIVSLLLNNSNAYRLSIYKNQQDNTIYFNLNIVGNQEKKFNINYCLEDNNISISAF